MNSLWFGFGTENQLVTVVKILWGFIFYLFYIAIETSSFREHTGMSSCNFTTSLLITLRQILQAGLRLWFNTGGPQMIQSVRFDPEFPSTQKGFYGNARQKVMFLDLLVTL